MRHALAVVIVGVLASLALAKAPEVLEELTGTYRTTLAYEDLTAQDFREPADLVGTWTMTFHEGGYLDYTYRSETPEGMYEINSVYVVHNDRIYVGAETGAYRCQDIYGVTAGVYSWSRQSNGSLVLTAIEDGCIERRIVFTAHPLIREPE